MNVGLVARADDRGIGTMTREFYESGLADRTLVVREPGAESRGFAPHVERYGDSPVVVFDPQRGQISETITRDWLRGLDVVYLVETPYDYRFFDWCRDAGVVSVLHAMPEFWRWADGTPRPDVWWLPTSWRADVLPAECRVVPVPVPCAPRGSSTCATATFVHVVGHRAVGDRNGTLMLMQALRRMRSRCTVKLVTQDKRLPSLALHPNVKLSRITGGVADRWALYDDADVLVLPRRYGGLCLPALEAMARGLGLVMSAVEPQRSTWPGMFIPARGGRSIEMPCGTLRLADTDPLLLARALDGLAGDADAIEALREESRVFAQANGWEHLRRVYVDELGRALERRAA